MKNKDVVLDEEFDKLIKDGKTANFETREGLLEEGTPISKDEMAAYEKALQVSSVDLLTKQEQERATRQANKIVEAFNKTKKKVGRFLALFTVCSVIATGAVISATYNLITYENNKREIKQIALSEEGSQQAYNEKLSGVKTEFETGEISQKEYVDKIEEVSKSFDYEYLKNAVMYKAQNEYVKRAVKDLDSDAGLKLRGAIAGYIVTAAALGVALDANSKKKKYSHRSSIMKANKKDAEKILDNLGA